METRQTLGPNQAGEICVKSLSKMIGYYKNPQETKKSLSDDGILIKIFKSL